MKRVRTTGMKLVNMKSEVKDLGGLKKVVSGLEIHNDGSLESEKKSSYQAVGAPKLTDFEIKENLAKIESLKQNIDSDDIPSESEVSIYWSPKYGSSLNNLMYHFGKHGKKVLAQTPREYLVKSIEFRNQILTFKIPPESLEVVDKQESVRYKNNYKVEFIILDKVSNKIHSFGRDQHMLELNVK